jgi:hypothetical protein
MQKLRRNASRENESACLTSLREAVGWAKRSVPTFVDVLWKVGTAQARLCPPYVALPLRDLSHRLICAFSVSSTTRSNDEAFGGDFSR